MEETREIIDKLEKNKKLSESEFLKILYDDDREAQKYLSKKALSKTREIYGNKIFVRGLIEFSNYCKNDCYYCGIRCSNRNLERYRLSKEDILKCCEQGYKVGFRTFVLQSGEDFYYKDELIKDIVKSIKANFKDCVVTLSIGERSKKSYQEFFDAGAERFLLRHEAINPSLFSKLHPDFQTFETRKKALLDLKEIGYQVGCGFMVGVPFQTFEDIAKDLVFISKFKPSMVGIGPFIPHKDTPFREFNKGSVNFTLKLISILRLIDNKLLIPATTALATLSKDGRLQGILAGANVIMPNLSPKNVRNKYSIYENKASFGTEAFECMEATKKELKKIGYEVSIERGDYFGFKAKRNKNK